MRINESRFRYFWDHVVEETEGRVKGQSPCWLWIGNFVYIPNLYARMSTVGAAQCSAAILCRAIPSKSTHRCNTNLCVNPGHLIISLKKDKPPRFSALTGKPLKPKLTEDETLIRGVLSERGIDHSGDKRVTRRKVGTVYYLSKRLGVSEETIKKILLKAPLYDLLDEIKELERLSLPVQLKPHKKQGQLDTLDTIHYNRNAALPEFKNEA